MATKIGHVEVKIDPYLIERVEEKAKEALVLTGEAVIRQIEDERIVPKASGMLESTLHPLDTSELDNLEVRIWSETPYARRLYFNAEGFKFHREPWEGGLGNANAQDHWFEPWITGVYVAGIRAKLEYYLRTLK